MKRPVSTFFKKVINIYKTRLTVRLVIVMSLIIIVLVLASMIFAITSIYELMNNNITDSIRDSIIKANDSFELLVEDAERINSIIGASDITSFNYVSNKLTPDIDWFNQYKLADEFLSSLINTKADSLLGVSVFSVSDEVIKGGAPLINEDIRDEEWFVRLNDSTGESIIVKRDIGQYGITADKKYVLSICRAVLDYGSTKAIIVSDIDFDVLYGIFELNSIPDASIAVLDDKNNVMLEINNTNDLEKSLNTDYDFYDDYIIIDEVIDDLNWTTHVLIPRSIVLSEFSQMQKRIYLFAVLIILIGTLIIITLLREMTKNINHLHHTMTKVSEGDLDAEPNINSEDEIGKLSEMFSLMMGEIRELLSRVEIKESEKREAEIEALQYQINPHFLCNTLNTIKYLGHMQNADNICDISASLNKLLRLTIDNSHKYITIEEEIDLVKSYFEIQKYKYLDRISLVLSVDDDVRELKTIKMILQPIVENAIVHGIDPKGDSSNGVITIKAYTENDRVIINIMDNGIGIAKEKIDEIFKDDYQNVDNRFGGIGINNTNKRIKNFFGEEFGIRIYSQLNMYTTVEVSLPILE